jgi:two-component system, chemotaxis family, sensor kinase CheA
VLTLRERVLPLLRLSEEFEIPRDTTCDKFYVVVVGMGERHVGVIVDRLRSQEEVVIKSMGDYLSEIKGVAGATITGEGKVVLILDIPELVQSLRGGRQALTLS